MIIDKNATQLSVRNNTATRHASSPLLGPKTPPPTTTPKKTKEKLQVLLCGCGNAVHTLIAYLGAATQDPTHDYEYVVHVLSLSHADRLQECLGPDGTIRCITDQGHDKHGKAHIISSDASQVVPGSHVILFALPTDRHELYLNAMKPFIAPHTYIGSMPGEGGFDLCIRHELGEQLCSQCILFAFETLPWACRISEFGQVVQVLGTKKDIDMCVHPGNQCQQVQRLLQDMIGPLPQIETNETALFLGSTIMNPNAIAHPSILYGLLHQWDGVTPFKKPPLFYQAMDDFTAETMSDVSNEILDIKAAILKRYPHMDLHDVRHIQDMFENAYAEDIADHSSLKQMFVTNKGYDGLTMPHKAVPGGGFVPQFDHRYLNEDLPCGILVQKGIAELAGVETPVMDKIIEWCQARTIPHREYLVNGKLRGKDVATTKAPQRYGFADLDSFLKVNGYV